MKLHRLYLHPNRLLNHDGHTDVYHYDAHGNTTEMPHLAIMQYDHYDQLREVDLGGGGTAYYVYDASGGRIRKVIEKTGGIVEQRIYLGGWEVYRKTISGNLNFERETLRIMDDRKAIAQIETKTVEGGMDVLSHPAIRYQYDNHLGSACLELDENAAIISYEEYHPFGTTSYRSGRTETEVSLKRYKYVGKERDEETGLYYYGARYFAAWIGRFVSVDALQFDYPQLTPYNYAGNKPITHKDIDGLQSTGDIPIVPTDKKLIEQATTKIDSFGSEIKTNQVEDKKDEANKAADKKDVENLTTSQKGIDFIKDYEKLKKNLYNDDTGNATIGYGHLVHKGKVGTDDESEKEFKKGITAEKAEEILKQDIKDKAEKFIKDNVTEKLSQNQFDALVAFTFNVGGGSLKSSTLLKKVNAGETDSTIITKWFKAWNKGTVKGEKVELKGLTTRRGQEADIYNKNLYDSTH